MKATSILILFIILLSAITYAQEPPESTLNQIKDKKDEINQKIDELPSMAKWLITDDKINIKVKHEEITKKYKIEIKENKLHVIDEGSFQNPSIVLDLDYETILKIQNADDKRAESKKALEEEKINIRGNGFFNRLRVGILKGIIKRAI